MSRGDIHNPIQRFRKHGNFTVLDNDLIRDKRITFQALGLLTFMLHLPPDFQLRLAFLEKQRKGNGRDFIRARMAELEKAGSLRITRLKDGQGRWRATLWQVTEVPDQWHGYSPDNPDLSPFLLNQQGE